MAAFMIVILVVVLAVVTAGGAVRRWRERRAIDQHGTAMSRLRDLALRYGVDEDSEVTIAPFGRPLVWPRHVSTTGGPPQGWPRPRDVDTAWSAAGEEPRDPQRSLPLEIGEVRRTRRTPASPSVTSGDVTLPPFNLPWSARLG